MAMPVSRRAVLVALAALVVGTVVAAAWVVTRVLVVRDELAAARADVKAARQLYKSADLSGAQQQLRQAAAHAARAKQAADDPVWGALALVPYLGRPLDTTRGLARSIDTLSVRVLPNVLTLVNDLRPEHFKDGAGVDVTKLERAAGPLARAAASVEAEQSRVEKLSPTFVPAVRAARREYLGQLRDAERLSRTAADITGLAPTFLGANQPRRYFVAFQNLAEARATGGVLGAYATVIADRGRVRLERLGSNTDLHSISPDPTGVPPELVRRYGSFLPWAVPMNADLSPYFPYAVFNYARIYRGNTGDRVDGVIAVTPRALAALMRFTGPVTLRGYGSVSAQTVLRFISIDEYALEQNTEKRKQILVTLAGTVVKRLFSGSVDVTKVLPALPALVESGDVRFNSTRLDEQDRLRRYTLGGAAPGNDAKSYVVAAIDSATGGKQDAYLHVSIRREELSCERGQTRSRLTVSLRNDAPTTGLPDYVVIRSDHPRQPVVRGQNRSWLQLFLTDRARLDSATVNGRAATILTVGGPPPKTLNPSLQDPVVVDRERSLSVFSTYLETPPQQSTNVMLEITSASAAGPMVVATQPMMNPPVIAETGSTSCPK